MSPPAEPGGLPGRSPSWRLARTEDGRAHFRLWEPSAERAWWVPFESRRCHPMARPPSGKGAGEVWELAAPCPEGGRYGFVVEWRQELQHVKGLSARFGLPNAEACFRPPPRPQADEASARPCGKSAQAGATGRGSEESCTAALTPGAEEPEELEEPAPSPAERLGEAEFLLELEEMAQVVSEAEGARVSFFVAPGVLVKAVEVVAGDGSWGPVALMRAESEEDPGPDNPRLWIGETPELREEGAGDGSGIVIRVTRRDWRIDPYALVLSRGVTGRPSTAGSEDPELPWGPLVWCHASSPPLPPATPFTRCSDRELVLYELHVGSFTPEGTFRAAAAKLGHIRDLGCTALSIMPVQQDARRLELGERNMWGYDIISFLAIDAAYGTPADLAAFVAEAHRCGLAVLVDFVANHMMWGADAFFGRHFFLRDMETCWGPRPDFSQPEVTAYGLAAIEFLLLAIGFDGVRVDSTKSIRKFPDTAGDAAGAAFLGELTAFCRRHGRLAVAEDLEDGEGVLQQGGLGFHLQWDMAHFCWVYDALVNPMDEYRDFGRVVNGLVGLAAGRAHSLRGRVLFTETHDTAACDRYGRLPAAVHNGKSFIVSEEGDTGGGDAFQKAQAALPYPTVAAVEANAFAARRAALGLVLVLTAPGVPMFLQGQEVCESGPFKWPQGPTMNWDRLGANEGLQARWLQLCRQLVGLRLGRSPGSAVRPARRYRPAPLMGDGLHVFHEHGGVLAYLRWAEVADSREEDPSGPEIALVIVNCTNNNFPYYELGVPPSKAWRLALNTVGGAGCGDVVVETKIKATHNFPCALGVSLQAYSASIFLRES